MFSLKVVSTTSTSKQKHSHFQHFQHLQPEYIAFAFEEGPPSISEIAKAFIQQKQTNSFRFSCYSSHFTNSTLIACAIAMISTGMTPEATMKAFGIKAKTLAKYRDASHYPNAEGTISILHCLKALRMALNKRLLPFSLAKFPISQWKALEQPENGDLNWIVRGKIVAFAAPLPDNSQKVTVFMRKHQIDVVVRLSEETCYDEKAVYGEEIRVERLYFPDGSVPSLWQVSRFVQVVEQASKVAVHCRAGLGRTGTMICCWLMERKGFSPRQAIAYLRIMRPGSVSAFQEEWLIDYSKKRQLKEKNGK